MKKIYTLIALFVAVTAMSISLTSCDEDYYGRPGNTYDPDLIGTWELYQADGRPVVGYQVNWLEFYRNGTGTYYYYSNGYQYSMGLNYGVQWYSGTSQLYINYSDGSSTSMDYWFNSNATYLYTQWYEYGVRHTYVYRYVNGPEWAPASQKAPADSAPAKLPSLTPGLSEQL